LFHDLLQSRDFASHAQILAYSVKFVCGVGRAAKSIYLITGKGDQTQHGKSQR
jgi:hypothetical protein